MEKKKPWEPTLSGTTEAMLESLKNLCSCQNIGGRKYPNSLVKKKLDEKIFQNFNSRFYT